jgi:hypothetical protein
MASITPGQKKVYDFKSVGFKQNELLERNPDSRFNSPRPIGIKTPIQFGEGEDGLFSMHRNLLSQIKDNLKNIIRTNHGERIPFYDFGANLLPMAFDISTEQGDMEAMRRINSAISKWQPLVKPSSYEPLLDYNNGGTVAKIGVRVGYDVPIIGVKNQFVEVVIYAEG